MPRETKAEREQREERERKEELRVAKEAIAYLNEIGFTVDFTFSDTSPPSEDVQYLVTRYFDNMFNDCSTQIVECIEMDYVFEDDM